MLVFFLLYTATVSFILAAIYIRTVRNAGAKRHNDVAAAICCGMLLAIFEAIMLEGAERGCGRSRFQPSVEVARACFAVLSTMPGSLLVGAAIGFALSSSLAFLLVVLGGTMAAAILAASMVLDAPFLASITAATIVWITTAGIAMKAGIIRRAGRHRRCTHCPTCDYPLASLPGPNCPECGHPFRPAAT